MLKRIMFDTSSLSELPQVCERAADFDAALRRQNATVTLHASVQQAAVGEPKRVRDQFARLHRLGFSRFLQTVSAETYLRYEKSPPPPAGVIESQGRSLAPLFETAKEGPEAFEPLRSRVADLWQGACGHDNKNMAEAEAAIKSSWQNRPQQQRRTLRPGLGGAGIAPSFVGAEDDEVARFLDLGFEGMASRAKASPHQHKAHLLFAGLATLNAGGLFLHGEHTPAAPYMRSDQDDYNDTSLAVEAAYCDVYVTEDDNLRDRLELLRDRGYAFFEVANIDGLLRG